MALPAQSVARFRFSARNALVVGQIALSLALLCTGGLFARGALAAAAADPGFRYDQLVYASIDPAMAGYERVAGAGIAASRVFERLRALPGIEAAATASTVPFGEFHEGNPVEARRRRSGHPYPSLANLSNHRQRLLPRPQPAHGSWS